MPVLLIIGRSEIARHLMRIENSMKKRPDSAACKKLELDPLGELELT